MKSLARLTAKPARAFCVSCLAAPLGRRRFLAEMADKGVDDIRPAADVFRDVVHRYAAVEFDDIVDADLIAAWDEIGASEHLAVIEAVDGFVIARRGIPAEFEIGEENERRTGLRRSRKVERADPVLNAARLNM